jgi:DNA repair protein RadC
VFPFPFAKEATMSKVIQAVSDADLLGMIVGTKAAARMLQDAGGSLSTLLHEPIPSYDAQPRVTKRLRVATELVRRSLLETLRQRDVLSSPATVHDYLRISLVGRDYEVFMALFLDAQNRVIETEEMFRVTLTQTYARSCRVRGRERSSIGWRFHCRGMLLPRGGESTRWQFRNAGCRFRAH